MAGITTPQVGGLPGSQSYYGISTAPSANEAAAGVAPQPFYSMLTPQGALNPTYAVDPTKSAAFQQMSDIATSTQNSPWAQMQLQANTANAMTQKDQAQASAQGQTDQAQQNLMTQGGGTNSGASALLQMSGARNQLMANQNINDQANKNALGIMGTDAQNKQSLLGQVANTETSAQASNAQTAMQDTTNANLYSTNRYNQQMQAWGASQTADAQRQAANNSGGKK